MGKRFFYTIGLFVLCAAGTFYAFKPRQKGEAEKALDHLKEHNYKAAETVINELKTQHSIYPLALYRGFIAQARGQFDESDFFLQMALKQPLKQNREDILAEILLAQTSNAYFCGRDQELPALIATAHRLSSTNTFFPFFNGLLNYLNGQHADALKAWKSFSNDEISEGSGWMPIMIESLFPTSWRQLHVAHCLIEEGDFLTAREILENQNHRISNDDRELRQLAALFLGLTYLKEAQQIPMDQRESYYKLARFYFERTGNQKTYEREQNRVIAHLQVEVEKLLISNSNKNQKLWGFAFVHTLQNWKADSAIKKLADRLAEKMLQQENKENVEFCHLIRQEFMGGPFHVFLTQKLLSAMAYELKDGETENLFELWAMVESLSPTPKLAAKQIATLTSEEIFRTIRRDSQRLDRTRYYIAFWETLGRSQQERELLTRNLLVHSKLLWQKEGHERKGQNLMKIALKVGDGHPLINREIERFLTALYLDAENTNMIARLTRIYDAMEHFNISRAKLISLSKVANHLADAEYLYHIHNYTSTKTHAEWILKLDPANEQAMRLLGLACFHLGEYGNALVALKPLLNPDEDARKALVLSQAFASQDQEKHLAQIDNTDSFDEDTP